MALRSQLALLGIKCFLTLISFVIVLDVLRQGIEKNKRKDHMKEANVSTKKIGRSSSSSEDFDLPWAEPFFYLDEKQVPRNLPTQLNISHKCHGKTVLPCCDVVHFIGSFKCASTTLASLLKNKVNNWEHYDPNSGFIPSPKELCWSRKTNLASMDHVITECSKCKTRTRNEKQKKVLDACIFYTGDDAERIFCDNPDGRLVMVYWRLIILNIPSWWCICCNDTGKEKGGDHI
ncbi:uncharacterized protein LOC142341413 [Convolutriloba macropyga]|uniref:uncharacterized protein LOC142341413 n=1 Tax=Convolutriloba macropyga TaxID=536237 RepID=UPI003F51D7CC